MLVNHSGRQLLFLTVNLLLITQGNSFNFSPFRLMKLQTNQAKLSGGLSLLPTLLTRTLSKISPSPLKSTTSQNTDIEPKSSGAVPFWNIANILTISRVLAIPFFMLSFVMRKVNHSLPLLYIYTWKTLNIK